MSKRKNKKQQKPKKEYDVGYCKPPEEYKWKKGCKSPNPSGRPKKVKNLQEALQLSLNKEVNTKDANGVVKKVSCLEALATKTVIDAISKDGPTRRMLYRSDLLQIAVKEQEYEQEQIQEKEHRQEQTENNTQIQAVEKEYGELLRQWAEMDPKIREVFAQQMTKFIQKEIHRRYYPRK